MCQYKVTYVNGECGGLQPVVVLLPRVEAVVHDVRAVPHHPRLQHVAALPRLLEHGAVDVHPDV